MRTLMVRSWHSDISCSLHPVSFDDSHSSGQIALVIYEWADADHLGVETPGQNETTGYLPVRLLLIVFYGYC